MSAFNNMQPVEQLYAFMDGELDPFFENQLFGELAVNEDLRAEMKDLLTMREAVRRDAVLPSPLVKERLLASAGLAGTSAALTAGFWSAARSAFSAWVAPLLGVALGAGSAALILLSHRPAEPPSTPVLAQKNDIPALTLIASAEKHSGLYRTFGAVATELKRPRRTIFHSHRIVASVASVAGKVSELQNTATQNGNISLDDNSASDEAQNSSAAKESAASLNTADLQTKTSINSTDLLATTQSVRITRQSADSDNDSHQSVSIRFRGLFNQSFPASNISAESNSWINNTAFGAIFHFTPELAAGVEIGMERFAQVFGSAEGASEVWYEQNPQMLWAGALAQYKLMQIGDKMDTHVYGESFIGAAGTLGFLGRQAIGVNITPIPSLTVSAGAEAAILPYIYKSHWFSTEKFGLTLGISFTPEGLR